MPRLNAPDSFILINFAVWCFFSNAVCVFFVIVNNKVEYL